jgi:hypothetical protein
VKAFVAVFGLGLCANADATTIVAIWTPSKIVIAGDSMINMNWTGENGVPQHKLSKECKIRKYGSNYISAAGNYHIQAAGFDVWDIAERSCSSSMNFEICAARFKADLRSILGRVVGVHDIHLTVLVAGRQNGSPALEHITFVSQPDGRLNIKSESFRRGKQKWGRVILGDRDAIDRYERGSPSTPGSSMAGSIQEQALSLVRIEARAAPKEVGAPFSAVTIEASGEQWINPGCCPASCSK